jgi:hypothetical protein
MPEVWQVELFAFFTSWRQLLFCFWDRPGQITSPIGGCGVGDFEAVSYEWVPLSAIRLGCKWLLTMGRTDSESWDVSSK